MGDSLSYLDNLLMISCITCFAKEKQPCVTVAATCNTGDNNRATS